MKIQTIKSRNVLFTQRVPEGWDYNIQLIFGKKYNFVVDTGLGSSSVEPVIKYLSQESKPILVINTHYHWDHIWGNSSVNSQSIISHKLCRDMIIQNWDAMVSRNGHFIKGKNQMLLPDITFEQELYFPEDQIRLMYSPGHTVDSISVLDEVDKVLNISDNIGDDMEELIPNLSCSNDEYIRIIKEYQGLDFDTVLSGHNVVTGKDVFDKILSLI